MVCVFEVGWLHCTLNLPKYGGPSIRDGGQTATNKSVSAPSLARAVPSNRQLGQKVAERRSPSTSLSLRRSRPPTEMLATTAMLALATRNVSIPTREIARDINGNAVNMPVVSIGTRISSKGEDPYQIVYDWLKLGGRGIDTALIYHDQAKVKQAIADAGLSRDDVFITSKIASCSQDEFITRKGCRATSTRSAPRTST